MSVALIGLTSSRMIFKFCLFFLFEDGSFAYDIWVLHINLHFRIKKIKKYRYSLNPLANQNWLLLISDSVLFYIENVDS